MPSTLPDALGRVPAEGTASPGAIAEERRGPGAIANRLRGSRIGWLALAACLFLLAHLLFLAPTLDDIDGVNFAFGVEAFDPAAHHPHPPGYPVYILLGKLSTAALDVVRSPDAQARATHDNAALALAFWSALFGALGLVAWYLVFAEIEALGRQHPVGEWTAGPDGGLPFSPTAAWAALLTAAAPLMWLSASRPMSDVPGLTASCAAQALLLESWRRENAGSADLRRSSGRWLLAGALVAALSLGIRSQVLWLTLPLLAAVVVARARRVGVGSTLSAAGTYALGIAAWAVPMILATGNWRRYLSALGAQGGEDFAGVDMLWTHPGGWRALVGLAQTFVFPWSSIALAACILGLAALGALHLWRRHRVALALLVLLAAPYAVFHTLFQETATTRYALPLVPTVSYLAVCGAARARRRVGMGLAAIAVLSSLAVAVPAAARYASMPSPIFRAVAGLRGRAAGSTGVLGMHRRISTESRVALQWAREPSPAVRRLPSPRGAEWQQAAQVLREAPDATLWFLAEPRREGELLVRDLALVDPASRSLLARYRWSFDAARLLGGARPDEMDLHEIHRPGWLLGDGWAVTPETAGLAARSQAGPSYAPIHALIRRRSVAAALVIGGRHLGSAADGSARLEVRVDDRPLADFVVPAVPRFFLHVVPIPAGTLVGDGSFARLTVRATPADGPPRRVPVAIEQFDLQDADAVMWGFDTGWQEAEYDPEKQLLWRWMSERSTLLLHAGSARAVTLRAVVESPRRYFDRPARLRLLAGDVELANLLPDAGMPRLLARLAGERTLTLTIPIAREVLDRAAGRLTLEADQFFVPAGRAANGDQRHLATRVFEVQITRGQ